MPGRLHLASVRRCETGSASVLLRREGGAWEAAPFLCRTWRCRRCGPWVDAQLLHRIRAGVGAWPWALYLVLTLDPATFRTSWDGYALAGEAWDKRLRHRIARRFGKVEYVVTVERHVGRSRHPHLNVLLRGAGLEAAARDAGSEMRFDAKAGHGKGRWCRFSFLRPWFARVVPEVGFGRRVWCEEIVGADGLAHYLARATADLASARFKSSDQTPLGAPPHLRRLRSSEGTLPKAPEPEEPTEGVVALAPMDALPRVVNVETGELEIDPAFVEACQAEAARRQAWARGRARQARYEV